MSTNVKNSFIKKLFGLMIIISYASRKFILKFQVEIMFRNCDKLQLKFA